MTNEEIEKRLHRSHSHYLGMRVLYTHESGWTMPAIVTAALNTPSKSDLPNLNLCILVDGLFDGSGQSKSFFKPNVPQFDDPKPGHWRFERRERE